jgi:hypothetical protein
MLPNIYLDTELDPETNPPTRLAMIAELELMDLEVGDGESPSGSGFWIETEDIPDENANIEDAIPGFDLIKVNAQKAQLKTLVFQKSRREQLDMWFQGVDAIRKQLAEVSTKEQLYTIATFAADLDEAIEESNDWDKGFDSLDKLSREFKWAEKEIERLAAIKVSQARYTAYGRSVIVHVQEVKLRDNTPVHA